MSANIVIDTNVLLLADMYVSCYRIAKVAMQQPEEYVLFLDRDQKIDREYNDNAKSVQQDDEATIRLFTAWLAEREQRHQTNRLHPRISGFSLFSEQRCRQTAEAALIGIACGQANTYLVIPEQRCVSEEPIQRCYREPRGMDQLCARLASGGNPINVLPSDEIDRLTELNQLHIHSYDQLYAFLSRNRVDFASAERTAIELKCPDMNEGLTREMVDRIMEVLCGMLNTLVGPGYVFVGVRDGNIFELCLTGIPLRFNRKNKPSWDELKRDVLNRLNCFKPHIPARLDFEVIPDSDNAERGILAWRVRPNEHDRDYTYKGKRYVRVGESTRTE